jgi:hypothetical protein
MTLIDRLRREVTIRVWQVTGITLALSGTWALGIYGSWRYFEDRDHAACVERNELRTDIRQAFDVTFSFLESAFFVNSEIGDGVLAEIDRVIPLTPCN